MGLFINTNIGSVDAQRFLSLNTQNLQSDYTDLSSGLKINTAADDAAGLRIASNLTTEVNGTQQAEQNVQDGTAALQIADGAFSTVQNSLQRIRELVVEAANDTNGSEDRAAIKQEITQRLSDIDQITKSTSFNGINLLQGNSATTSLRIQVGANSALSLNTINIGSALGSATSSTLGITSVNVSTNSKALALLGMVDKALDNVASRRSTIGSLENRLSDALSNLQVANQNFQSALSEVQDVDVASETADLTKNQILQSSAAAVLTQANKAPETALTLIQAATQGG